MIPIGYEYGFRKKLHVVETTPDDWEDPAFDLTEFIGAVNKMKAAYRVLNEEGPQRHVSLGKNVACLVRRTEDHQDWAVTLINIDRGKNAKVGLKKLDIDLSGGHEVTPGKEGHALPSGKEVRPGKEGHALPSGKEVTLEPGEVRVFVGQKHTARDSGKQSGGIHGGREERQQDHSGQGRGRRR
jgi:hypothetical protein